MWTFSLRTHEYLDTRNYILMHVHTLIYSLGLLFRSPYYLPLKHINGWMDGWMDEWMYGWMDGWMDG